MSNSSDTASRPEASPMLSVSSNIPQTVLQEGKILKWVNYYHSWKERYFEVEPGILKYGPYKGTTKESSILLNNACKIRLCPGDQNRLEIEHSLGVLYLKFESEGEKKSWTAAIKRARDIFANNQLYSSNRLSLMNAGSKSVNISHSQPHCSEIGSSEYKSTNHIGSFDVVEEEEQTNLLQTLLEKSMETRQQLHSTHKEVAMSQQQLIMAVGVFRDSQFREDAKRIVLRLIELLDTYKTVFENQLMTTEHLVTLESVQRRKMERSMRSLARQNYIMERQMGCRTLGDSTLAIAKLSGFDGSSSSLPTADIFNRVEPLGHEKGKPDVDRRYDMDDESEPSDEFFDVEEDKTSGENKVLKEYEDMYLREGAPSAESSGAIKRRNKLPCPRTEFKIRIWSLLKGCIGKDLSRISMPVYFNEPTSLLQRLAEDFQYSGLLNKASSAVDSVDRLLWVTIFSITPYASAVGRTYKPFNPLLGETSEFSHRGFKFLSEQVGHHPPVTAYYCESDNYVSWGSMVVNNKFTGRSLEISMPSTAHVFLPNSIHKDHYTYGRGKMLINNIIFGKLLLEIYGFVTVVNHITGDYAVLEFMRKGWWDSEKHLVRGIVFDRKGIAVYRIGGVWSSEVWVEDCILPNVDSRAHMKHSQKIPNVRSPQPNSAGIVGALIGEVGLPISPTNISQVSKTSPSVVDLAETPTWGSLSASPTKYSKDHRTDDQDKNRRDNSSEGHSDCEKTDKENNTRPRTAICRNVNCIEKRPPAIPASADLTIDWDAYETDSSTRRVVWRPEPRPPWSSNFYDFGKMTFELNELSKDYDTAQGANMPPTDSRYRPDQRCYENGDVDLAHTEKLRIEELQRERARRRTNGEEDHQPSWFFRGKNCVTGEPCWLFNGEYWTRKAQKGGFDNCTRIFE